jgi:predicted DNA-binding protein
MESSELLVSLVFRIPRPCMQALRELVARTRVRQSEYLREAIEDLLRKHGRERGAQASI